MTHWEATLLLFCAGAGVVLLYQISERLEAALRLLRALAAKHLDLDD